MSPYKGELRNCFFFLAFHSPHNSITNAQQGKVINPEKRVRGYYHPTYQYLSWCFTVSKTTSPFCLLVTTFS